MKILAFELGAKLQILVRELGAEHLFALEETTVLDGALVRPPHGSRSGRPLGKRQSREQCEGARGSASPRPTQLN